MGNVQSAYPVCLYMHRINAISVAISGDRVCWNERMNKAWNIYVVSISFTSIYSLLQNMIFYLDPSSIQDRSKIMFC